MTARNMTIKDNKDAFLDAAANGLVEIVRESLQKKLCDVNCQDSRGWTALMNAADNGHKDIAHILIRHNCNVDLQNNNSKTALMIAADSGHKDIVDALLAHNCNLDLQNNDGYTALMYAAYKLSLIHI